MADSHPSTSSPVTPEVIPVPEPMERSAGSKAFLLMLGAVSILYAAVLIYHVSVPPGSPQKQAFLEQCRQICLKYGLVSTANVKHDARAFLTAVEARPLSQSLTEILSDSAFTPVPSDAHALVGKSAPDFELQDHHQSVQRLQGMLGDGPVMVVFYYGFHCSHCVAQLFAIHDDLKHFEELGVQVVAISQDTPEETAAALAEYGEFGFPLLSDPGNEVSARFLCSELPSAQSDGFLKHGTYLLDAKGVVTWVNTGFTPFVDNKSLLVHLAGMRNLTSTSLAAK